MVFIWSLKILKFAQIQQKIQKVKSRKTSIYQHLRVFAIKHQKTILQFKSPMAHQIKPCKSRGLQGFIYF